MDSVTAENIGKKARALKHCDKLLDQIDKNGSARIKLNCTGVEFIVHKGDAIYLSIQKTKYALLCDIRSYEITVRAKERAVQPIKRTASAAVGTSPSITEEDLIEKERKRAKQREYQERYRAKKKLIEKI